MELTPAELRALRDIILRAVHDCHDVLAVAARRTAEVKSAPPRFQEARSQAAAPSQQPENPRLAYSMKEAAQALGVARSTLWKMVSEGELEVRRLGRRVLVPAEVIQNLLNRQ